MINKILKIKMYMKFFNFLFLFLLMSFLRCEGSLSKSALFPLNDTESYRLTSVYSEEDPSLLLAQMEENGLKIEYTYNINKQPIAIYQEFQGALRGRCFYFYDQEGNLEEIIADDGCKRDQGDLAGATFQQIIRLERGNAFPLEGKPLKIENIVRDLQLSQEQVVDEIIFHYDEDGELLIVADHEGNVAMRADPSQAFVENNGWHDTISCQGIWKHFVDSIVSCFTYFQANNRQMKEKWDKELQQPLSYPYQIENFAKTLFGKQLYILMEPRYFETDVNVYGEHEKSDKVRISFINGILNAPWDIQESLTDISESHGGNKVHYVYRPTEGWMRDVSGAAIIKTGFATLGFRSRHAYLLADLWRKLIQDMGGVDGGGVIIHYAHSLGGTETDRARGLLTPEEQKMIRVVTFGSATLVRNEGFQSVINIVSVNDGVANNVIIEPLGLIRNFFDPKTNVRFCGVIGDYPIVDHEFNGKTYRKFLFDFGQKFLEEFSPEVSDLY